MQCTVWRPLVLDAKNNAFYLLQGALSYQFDRIHVAALVRQLRSSTENCSQFTHERNGNNPTGYNPIVRETGILSGILCRTLASVGWTRIGMRRKASFEGNSHSY